MMLFLLLPWAVGWLAILPTCSCFLPTSLNFSDPDLASLFCPEKMDGPTTDHKAITREALRWEVRRFFLEIAPANASLTIPEDASLSEMFRDFYGPSASPARFIKAVNDIAWSNALMEAGSQTKFQAKYHMDGERLEEGHALLQGRYQQMIRTITVDKSYDFSRELLGASLNGIQDFYSQTTWVELGRDGVFEGLGMPGINLTDVAGPTDAVCTNCDSLTGMCTGNVIPTGRLSSGYYEYSAVGASGFIIPKPENVGKCSHGGSMDSSVTMEATGGINKESSSPCFSPHHYLHQQAVDLAITASEHYIKTLRDAIGNDHFTNLLNLYQGSALSIVIDTTGSMIEEIETVKEEAKLIVQNSHPELYIFVPFGDPDYGPVTQTSDAEEFLAVLDSITAGGGCCCIEEKFWHGLQLALINTPDYSTVFCFTDAGANDAELMEGVLALVAAKNIKVIIIYSYTNRKEGGARSCPGYVTSGVDELEYLATISGGLFLELYSFDINDIGGIMEDSVGENKVSIAKRDGVKNQQNFSFPIDDTVINLDIVIYGPITRASITDSLGNYYDLMDMNTLNSTEGVEIISYIPNLRSIRFITPVIGEWFFEADGADSYSISVSASSTLGLLTEFAELDLVPPRPGYVVVRGHPLAGEKYYVEVTLIGFLESHVESVASMKFVDTAGVVLSTVPYDGMVDEHFFILSEALPSGSFYIQVDGYLESGNPFTRLYPTMAQSVECLIDLLEEESVLSATPGQSTQAIFRVHNYGPEADFQYTAVDEEKFISSWSPNKTTIDSMGWVDVSVDFMVPSSTPPGTTSTITFTASSLLSENNVNTYITYYIVLDEDDDSVSPTCESSDTPDCSGFDAGDTCSGKSWAVGATLHDTESGLLQVYSQPEGDLTLDGFTMGTTDPVMATFTTDCCLRSLTILGVDVRGNVGYCRWDLDPLKGSVIEFVAEEVGESWVYLRWNVSEARDDLSIYSILIDEYYTDNSRCPELVCHLNVTYLESCTLHTFTLLAHYRDAGGVETTGSPFDTEATTLGPVPEAPTNATIDYVSDTSTSISWTPPSNTACLHHFQVCLRMVGATESHCNSSSTSSIIFEGLEPCTVYHVNITSVSISGQHSDALTFDTNTDDAAPGAPQNLRVNNQTAKWVELAWDNPLERANCVRKWEITYIEEEVRFQEVEVVADNYATVSDLKPCFKYTFFVSGVSSEGAQGSTETTQTVLDEIEPTAVLSVEATAVNASSMQAVWVPAVVEECVHHYLVCIIELISLTLECHNSTGIQDTFTGLEACAEYEVTVTSVAPSGKLGSLIYDLARTMDLAPSPPTSLEVTDIMAHSAVVSYEPPLENSVCVKEYDIEIEELEIRGASTKILAANVFLQQIMTGLDACTDYEVRVSAVTATGLASEKVNSNFTTAEDTPSAVRVLTHVAVAMDQVQLYWFSPLVNPMCVSTYKLSWTNGSDSGSLDYTTSGHPPEVTVTVSGLESCSSYTFTVLAVTPLGNEGPPASHTVATSC